MKFKYNIGDTCYIASRHDGIVKVTIVQQIDRDGEPFYELDKLVQVSKELSVGAPVFSEYEGYYGSPEYEAPCDERRLMQPGDPLQSAIGNMFGFFGGTEVFTQEDEDVSIKIEN